MINIADESTALLSLVGGQITQKADGSIIFHDGQTPPTQAEIDAEIIRLQAEHDAQAYARKREAEYPSIQELVVALYDTDDKSAIEVKRAAVKAKYPKG
tara:strand:- start:254 stop:550 length:297 start_codon:yes stop_codon:yes gene_type:complete